MEMMGIWARWTLAAGVALFAATAQSAVIGQPDAWLDYVESDGNQYIDTGVNAATGVRASLDLAWTTNSASMVMLGAKGKLNGSGTVSRFFPCYFKNSKPYFGYGKGDAKAATNGVAVAANERIEIMGDLSSTNALQLYQNGAETLDATQRATFAAKGDVNMGRNLYLFAVNDGDAGAAGSFAKARLYECKIWRANGSGGFDLIRHYRPCYKDGRAALYDAVEGTISFSEGAAEFIAPPTGGKPVVRLGYVESDGKDDYIDLGVRAKDGTKILADVEWLRSEWDTVLVGARCDSGDGGRFLACASYQYAHRNAFHYFCETNADSAITVNTRYLVSSTMEAYSQQLDVRRRLDGMWAYACTNRSTFAGAGFDAGVTLHLFACNDVRAKNAAPKFSKVRLYALKIWQKDDGGSYALVRSLVPVISPETGFPALYDKVEGRCYENDGVGDLVGGGGTATFGLGAAFSIK